MKVNNTAIIKSESIKTAIITSISEFFNEEAIANFMGILVIDGNVGSCFETEVGPFTTVKRTTYFIATTLDAGLIRVEQCIETEYSETDRS